jgi:hypothetical protein
MRAIDETEQARVSGGELFIGEMNQPDPIDIPGIRPVVSTTGPDGPEGTNRFLLERVADVPASGDDPILF